MQNSPFDWASAREALKTRLGSEVVGRWLDPLSLSSVTDDSVILEAPNAFFRDWVATHYLESLKSSASGREVHVITAGASSLGAVLPSVLAATRASVGVVASAPASAVASAAPAPPLGSEGSLNGKLTFDQFVVGPSNRFAHAASLAVAESPARAYNPLFIYGGVGLGKTHLMQAIGHAILHRWPAQRVVYLSSERFAHELITAIQTRTTAKFRDRYRTVDVLLVDDIHFIAEKEATQEEFFHTFNALYDAHKQIIMSSDRPPKELAGIEERLVNRFEWGLVTDIQPPDLETRIAILRKKSEQTQLEVPDEVTDFIGRQISSNIRELEGALIRVVAYCTLFNKAPSAAIAHEVLKDMVREVSSRVTIDTIQQRVADYFKVPLNELRGVRRERSVLYPRQVAMYLCRRLTEASLPEIALAFGGRDHTTVMRTVEKISQQITHDLHKKHEVDRIGQLIASASHG